MKGYGRFDLSLRGTGSRDDHVDNGRSELLHIKSLCGYIDSVRVGRPRTVQVGCEHDSVTAQLGG